MLIKNLIAGEESAEGKEVLHAINPVTKEQLPNTFAAATPQEIERTVQSAQTAWKTYRNTSGKNKAAFLRQIAEEIESLGDTLVQTASQESGLPEGRITGERGRTCGQLRQFATSVEEGSWVDAIIDTALPDRKPMPRVDLRKMNIAIGPVVVFTASNFPLAFSTAGGDTASALAAGCPVIVKAHPSHLGTNALVSQAITSAIQKCGLPKGVFSTLQGELEVGQALVKNPAIKAVGFTGSFKGGKALFEMANARSEPIPVYAEMGSSNPIFALPGKLQEDPKHWATTIANSVNMGAGQFCTNPGIIVVEKEGSQEFLKLLKEEFKQLSQSTMLNEGIYQNYQQIRDRHLNYSTVQPEVQQAVENNNWAGAPSLASIRATDFIGEKNLQEEVFGPYTLVVQCDSQAELLKVADSLQGQLTATILGNEQELEVAQVLVATLIEKAGRILCNGVPTGVEVCRAMHHGGPFPATTNAASTSVGLDAIKRFVRPVTFQNIPVTLLPDALKPNNPLGIWRTVNDRLVKE